MTDGFIILGDLTEREDGVFMDRSRTLIVRMFVGGQTFDDELTVDSLEVARDTIAARMAVLAVNPDRSLIADAKQPETLPDDAIALPPIDDPAVKT